MLQDCFQIKTPKTYQTPHPPKFDLKWCLHWFVSAGFLPLPLPLPLGLPNHPAVVGVWDLTSPGALAREEVNSQRAGLRPLLGIVGLRSGLLTISGDSVQDFGFRSRVFPKDVNPEPQHPRFLPCRRPSSGPPSSGGMVPGDRPPPPTQRHLPAFQVGLIGIYCLCFWVFIGLYKVSQDFIRFDAGESRVQAVRFGVFSGAPTTSLANSILDSIP